MRIMTLAATVLAAAAGLGATTPANASVTLTNIQGGTSPYSGPTPTYDFNTAATTPAYTGGKVLFATDTFDAAPYGSSGGFYSVSPDDAPGVIPLSSFGAISSLSFLWGSADVGNTLKFFNTAGSLIGTFTGGGIWGANANGDRTSSSTNSVVTFSFTGADQLVGRLEMTSFPGGNNPTGQSFEIDNLAITAVPEPTVWALMLVGFGFTGAALRRRRHRLAVSFA